MQIGKQHDTFVIILIKVASTLNDYSSHGYQMCEKIRPMTVCVYNSKKFSSLHIAYVYTN